MAATPRIVPKPGPLSSVLAVRVAVCGGNATGRDRRIGGGDGERFRADQRGGDGDDERKR